MTDSAERLIAWADMNGGTSEVSKKSGLDRQVFHSLKTKDIEPSLPTLKKIHHAYPELDIHWVSTGEVREGKKYPIPNKSFIESDYERLKAELSKLENELQEIKREKGILFDLLGKDESEADSLLVDNELGLQNMWILHLSHGGFALNERLN